MSKNPETTFQGYNFRHTDTYLPNLVALHTVLSSEHSTQTSILIVIDSCHSATRMEKIFAFEDCKISCLAQRSGKTEYSDHKNQSQKHTLIHCDFPAYKNHPFIKNKNGTNLTLITGIYCNSLLNATFKIWFSQLEN